MTGLTNAVGERRVHGRRGWVSAVVVRRPWLPALLTSAAGWVALVSGPPAGGHAGHLWLIMAMSTAMMGPFAALVATAVARASLWWQAFANGASAVACYYAVWLAVGGATHAALDVVPIDWRIVAWTVAALSAADLLTRARRRLAVDRCAATYPIRPAHRWEDTSRWGLNTGWRCVRICVAPMTLAALGLPNVLVVVAVTALLVIERASARLPRALLAAAYVALCAALTL